MKKREKKKHAEKIHLLEMRNNGSSLPRRNIAISIKKKQKKKKRILT